MPRKTTTNRIVTSLATELKHQVGNERDDADQRNEGAEPAAFIFAGEKVGLRIETMIARAYRQIGGSMKYDIT